MLQTNSTADAQAVEPRAAESLAPMPAYPVPVRAEEVSPARRSTSAPLPQPRTAVPDAEPPLESLANVRLTLSPPESQVPQLNEPIWIGIIDRLVSAFGRSLNMQFFNSNARGLFAIGNLLVPVLAGLFVVAGGYTAAKEGSTVSLGIGIGMALGLFLLHYVAVKAINASGLMVASSPSQLSPTSFLKCTALFAILMALLFLAMAIVMCIQRESLTPLWTGVGFAIFFAYLVSLATNPELANVQIVESHSAGAEAIGMMSFALKSLLRLSSIFFGSWMIFGTLEIVQSIFNYTVSNNKNPIYRLVLLQLVIEAAPMIFWALLIPIVAYLVFLFYHLFVDLVTAILSLPGKLETAEQKVK